MRSEGVIGDGNYKEYYSEGGDKKTVIIIDGRMNGTVRTFYPGGALRDEAHFVEGKLNGSYRVYSQNGKLTAERSYVNGVLNGYSMEFAEDGSLKSKTRYVDGKAVDAPVLMEQARVPQPEPVPAHKPTMGTFSSKAGFLFFEGEIFSHGDLYDDYEKELFKELDEERPYFDSVSGEFETSIGVGASVGVNLGSYRGSSIYSSAGYFRGPSAEYNTVANDSSGYQRNDVSMETQYCRFLAGYRYAQQTSQRAFLAFDVNAGFGGGRLERMGAYTSTSYGDETWYDSRSWTGFTWSAGTSIAVEYSTFMMDFGIRYSVFPEFKGDLDLPISLKWMPLSVKASLMF